MYYGDELRIKLVATPHGKTSFKIDYEVFVKNSLAATAQSISTFYDYETQKICRMPQDFRDIIENKLVSAID
jgi:acyl-CoA thioesterase FadM